MRVIGLVPLRVFWQIYDDAEKPLKTWYKVAKSAAWKSLLELKQTYPSAEGVPIDCPCGKKLIATVINIGGNKYRLILLINYKYQLIYVKPVLTHKEYSKGDWRKILCPKQ